MLETRVKRIEWKGPFFSQTWRLGTNTNEEDKTFKKYLSVCLRLSLCLWVCLYVYHFLSISPYLSLLFIFFFLSVCFSVYVYHSIAKNNRCFVLFPVNKEFCSSQNSITRKITSVFCLLQKILRKRYNYFTEPNSHLTI